VNNFQKASVVVPFYNAERTIEDCLLSILNSDYPKDKYEIIFVDNNSEDGSNDILNRYLAKISNLRILKESTKGPSAARNKGILSANGEVVAFTDSDCVVDRNWLKNIVSPLKNKQIGIVGGRILAKQRDNKIAVSSESIHDNCKAVKFRKPYVISMNWASRTDVLKEIGLFDLDFIRAQDSEFSLRIYKSGYMLIFHPNAVIYHENSETVKSLFKKGYMSGYWGIKLYKKHKGYLKGIGVKRISRGTYINIINSFVKYLRNDDKYNSLCYFVYQTGRLYGRLRGSLRYKEINL